jgi:hypothetical protein
MRVKRISVIAATIAAVTCLIVLTARPAAGQDGDTLFTQDAIDAANTILSSPLAQFLSGTGVNTLERQSGQVGKLNLSLGGSPVTSPPFQSARFEVMVNDPADDVFAAFDLDS